MRGPRSHLWKWSARLGSGCGRVQLEQERTMEYVSERAGGYCRAGGRAARSLSLSPTGDLRTRRGHGAGVSTAAPGPPNGSNEGAAHEGRREQVERPRVDARGLPCLPAGARKTMRPHADQSATDTVVPPRMLGEGLNRLELHPRVWDGQGARERTSMMFTGCREQESSSARGEPTGAGGR